MRGERRGRSRQVGVRSARRALVAILRTVPLALCALLALRQDRRVRRALTEVGPPEPEPLPEPPPRVSIVLPVRDEEANVDGVLASLLAQDYPAFDLTVVDDGSSDATPRLLAAWAARDRRVRVHRVEELPPGWAGKAHALHIGVGLIAGEWLLFTDADTRHAPEALGLALGHALRHRVDLLSLLARSPLIGPGARLLTPIGAISLLERATPAEVRDPRHPAALAIGTYLLVRRAAYEACGGYAAPRLRATFADDVYLTEEVKRSGGRVDLVRGYDGRDLLSNEQWTTWDSLWRGWRKSAYGDIGHRPLYGLAGGLLLLAYGLLPPLAALRAAQAGLRRHRLSAILAALALAAQVDARSHLDREAGLSHAWSLTAPAAWAMLGVLILDTTRLALTGRGADWKGRTAPRSRGRAVGQSGVPER